MTRTVVAVDRQGRLTLPVDVRRRLGIGEATQLELKIESNTIRLRWASTIPGEDRWVGLHAGSDCFPDSRREQYEGRCDFAKIAHHSVGVLDEVDLHTA